MGWRTREQIGWLGRMPAERAGWQNVGEESQQVRRADLGEAGFLTGRPTLTLTPEVDNTATKGDL